MDKKFKEIKSVDAMSIAKIQALISILVGLIVGVFQTIILLSQGTFGFGYAILFLLVIVVFYAIFGFLVTLLIAFIYNKLSKKIGGIKIELK